MERKHSFSSTNRYWCERKLHFYNFIFVFKRLVLFQKIFKRSGKWSIKKVRKKGQKEGNLYSRAVYETRSLLCASLNMLVFHLNKSHEIKGSSPSDISPLTVKLCITTLINGANYLSGSQKSVTG